MNMDLAKRLIKLRIYNNMSQNDLAFKTNINKKDIEKWEIGKESPDGEQLVKLSQIYNMPIDEILLNFDTDNPQSTPEPVPIHINTVYEEKKKKSYNWYAFPYPIIVVALYIAIGLFFNVWHPTWLIILTTPIYYMMIVFNDSKSKNWYVFPYPIIVVILYLALGFDYGIWHPSWLIFLTIPIYYMIIAWLGK